MVSALFPLIVKGAETRRHGKTLVGPVDLTLDGSGATVVIGPNGAGKTTLLNLLHGTARLHKGSIEWRVDTQTARRAQSFVFQRPIMLRRSVAANLAYPLSVRRTPRGEIEKKVAHWAEQVGLAGMLDRQAPALSGGEQQKLALARALITEPELLFLDEPCASLDGPATRDIENILKTVSSEGTCLILATHDMGQARRLADQVIFLRGGKIAETAPAPRFFDHPITSEASAFLNGDIVE